MTLWDRIDRGRPVQLAILVAMTVMAAGLAYASALAFSLTALLGPGYLILGNPAYVEPGRAAGIAQMVGLGAAIASLLSVGWSARGAAVRMVRRIGGNPVALDQFPDTRAALEDMKIASGLPIMPSLYVIDSMAVNAALLPAGRRRLLVVTYGFATSLDHDTQRAVFASLLGRHVSQRLYGLFVLSLIIGPAYALYSWTAGVASAITRGGTVSSAHVSPFTVAAGIATLFAITRISGSALWTWLFLVTMGVAMPAVLLVAWLVTIASYRAHIALAHHGDAEAMLLLKDPVSLLQAIEAVIHDENSVPFARAAGVLFFCWPTEVLGFVDDPELSRVDRLRPLLGAAAVGSDA